MEYLAPSEDMRKLRKKRRRRRIALCLLVMIGTGSFALWQYFQKPHVRQKEFRFSCQESLPTDSSAYLSYGSQYEDVEFDAALFAMKEIGDYDVTVNFAEKAYTLHIKIVDDQPPQITFVNKAKAYLYVLEGQIYLEPLYSVSDESKVKVEISPSLDQLDTGSQEICVAAVDAYDNLSSQCKSYSLEKVEPKLTQIEDVSSVEELVNLYMQKQKLNQNTFGFYYYSPEDKETYVYNPDRVFTAASIIKVPLNMVYEDRYASGEWNPEDTIELMIGDIEQGAGDTVRDYKLKDKIPYSYLQKQSVENSDNTATNMLVRQLGGFTAFHELIVQYSDTTMPLAFKTQNVVTMNYMLDVMIRLYENQGKYQTLIEHMKKASVGEYLQESSDIFEIAQKYGMLDNNLHATGIVYTPKPYIVGIYTVNRNDGNTIIKELNEWLIAYQFQKSVLISSSK